MAWFPCYPRPGGRRVHKGRQILGAIWLAKWQAADSVRKPTHKQTNKWTRKQTNQWSKGRHLMCTSDFCMGTCVCTCVHASIQNHTCINMCICMCKSHIHKGIFSFYFSILPQSLIHFPLLLRIRWGFIKHPRYPVSEGDQVESWPSYVCIHHVRSSCDKAASAMGKGRIKIWGKGKAGVPDLDPCTCDPGT